MSIKPKWTAADRARHKAIRQEFVDRPTQEELQHDSETIKAGSYFAVKQLLHELKQARLAAGLTLADVAKRTGMDQATLSRLETGRQPNPTIDTLWRYARAVGRELQLGHVAVSKPTNGRKPRKKVTANGSSRAS